MITKVTSRQHFDALARKYDHHKNKNRYYYENLKKLLLKYFTLSDKSVLEIGCGTGNLIAALNPKCGVGVDISKNMIKIARKNHHIKNLKFEVQSAEKLNFKEKFDYIFMIDIVEHLTDIEKSIKHIKKCMNKNSILLIATANPLWMPILELAENLKLKMEEGSHKWVSNRYICKILRSNGFKIINFDNFLLIPIYIPIFSSIINDFFGRLPIIKKLGLIQVVTAKIKN